MNNYIFIVNNLNFGEISLTGEEIVNILVAKGSWLFTSYTPNIKKFRTGDKVIVYVAGKGNRYFCCNFVLSGEVTENKLVPENEKETMFFKMFDLACSINDIIVWSRKVAISDIKSELEFITDKKNYGLFLRQSTKVINEKDYNSILKAGNRHTS